MTDSQTAISGTSRSGFTMLEMLVVIFTIGVLVGLLLPAVQSAREAARRTSCVSHLVQLGLAVQAYHSSFEVLPAGTVSEVLPVENYPNASHHSWLIRVLPMLELRPLAGKVDWTHSVYDPANWLVATAAPQILQCPSDSLPYQGVALGNYAGVFDGRIVSISEDSRGLLIANRFLSRDDVPDGFAYTLLAGEKTLHTEAETDLGWVSGTRSTLRTTGYVPGHGRPAEQHSRWGYPTPRQVQDPYGRYRGDAVYDPNADDDPEADQAGAADPAEFEEDSAVYLGGDWGMSGDWDEGEGGEWEEPRLVAFPAPPAVEERTRPGGFDSRHTGGVNMLWGDGRVALVSLQVDGETFSQMGIRDDALPIQPLQQD